MLFQEFLAPGACHFVYAQISNYSRFEYFSSLERAICTNVLVAWDMKQESPLLKCLSLVECRLLTNPITCHAYSMMFTNAKNVKYLKCCDFFLLIQTLLHHLSWKEEGSVLLS